MTKQANQLIHETSPYLLQHAYNPVDWHPWNDATLQKAREENKLLIISVGYSACHWCHVMEHQSFEDAEVASWMNKYFVPVKVDREERPDVDQVYMQAAYLTSGRGGWPLNVIALPDGRPVFGGTYFPKDNWIKVLQYFASLFQNDPAKLTEQAEHLTKGIRSMDDVSGQPGKEDDNIPAALDEGTDNLLQTIDWEWGGRNGAPKFMMPNIWEFLLDRWHLMKDDKSRAAVLITLKKMALGGLNDHLAGGFTRYSTDIYWKVPHFEKMLYDNAQLISLYAHAYQATDDTYFQKIAAQTIRYCEEDWRSPEGGFFSAYDADSDGEEGKYYSWTSDEIDLLLGEDSPQFKKLYTISGPGNWEHGLNVLHRVWEDEEACRELQMTGESFSTWLDSCHKKLLKKRQSRTKPGLDNKQLASWNGLMIKGLSDHYMATGEQYYLEKAIDTARFIESFLLQRGGGLRRNYCQGKATIDGFLDDHALVIEAYLSLYQATFDEKYLTVALQLTSFVLEHFSDENSPFLYFTSSASQPLVSRPKELSDNVISASNSVMAHNLWQLGWIMDNMDWREKATMMCKAMLPEIKQNLSFYANWARLAQLISLETVQVAITGPDSNAWRAKLQVGFNPGIIWVGSNSTESNIPLLEGKYSDQTVAYVCRGYTCGLPQYDPDDVLADIYG